MQVPALERLHNHAVVISFERVGVVVILGGCKVAGGLNKRAKSWRSPDWCGYCHNTPRGQPL